MSTVAFAEPVTALFAAAVEPACRASVVVPARNEESGLPPTLDALRMQVDLHGRQLAEDHFEVLLLLNNCTDRSAEVVRKYQRAYPGFRLLVAECELEPERAHVGTARQLLMDAACERMEGSPAGMAVLSTDADTLVAPNWVAANLRELERGADVVGGAIHLFPPDFARLEPGIRAAYERDKRYQELVAELESILDPDPADPWPRHLQHFGASLACTCEVYRRSGGLPAVKPLEDVAFVNALRRVGARIRHSPEVSITTSARLEGRAEVGLSGQLRHWRNDVATGAVHEVESAEWLTHRFRLLGALRKMNAEGKVQRGRLWHSYSERLAAAIAERLGTHEFLARIDCNRLVEEMFTGTRHGEIGSVIEGLAGAVRGGRGRNASESHKRNPKGS